MIEFSVPFEWLDGSHRIAHVTKESQPSLIKYRVKLDDDISADFQNIEFHINNGTLDNSLPDPNTDSLLEIRKRLWISILSTEQV